MTDPKKDFNLIAKAVQGQAFVSQWLAKKSPLVYLYGHTGAGKTYALGTLLGHVLEDGSRPYAPVLYIDVDGGSETVGDLAENEDLCTLVEYDGRYGQELAWTFDKLKKAEAAKCGAIIIEGPSAIFSAMVTPEMRAIVNSAKGEAWQAHNEPSRKINTLWEAIKELKVNRNHAGLGVPIFVTLNCRQLSTDTKPPTKYFVPDFSENVTGKAMRTADAFIEIRRGSSSKMLCLHDTNNSFRKLRRPTVALAVQSAWDLTLPGMLALWAVESAKARRKLDKTMQAFIDASAEAKPEPAPEPEEKTS